MTKKMKRSLDPLYQLFEHFLMTRSYDDSAAFTKQLAEQYIAYLDASPAHVPYEARQHLLEDLKSEAHEMLVKKMYGCVDPAEYENRGAVMRVRGDEAAKALSFLPEKDTAMPSKDES